MPTNDEIIDKYDLEGDGDLGIEVNDAINEARTDTAKQLFAELELELQVLLSNNFGRLHQVSV